MKRITIKNEENPENVFRLFESLLQSLDTMVVFLDPDLRIRALNSLAEEYLGLRGAEIQGLCFSDLKTPEYLSSIIEALEASR